MKTIALLVAAVTFVGGLAAIASGKSDEGRMPDLDGALAWLNSARLDSKAPRGRVVMVNFWTYSCINSLRELPYLKAWAAKYKDAGLIVIGVHAPEFGFEREPENVKTAVAKLKIEFPIPIDSNHSIWSAFHNQYWPADYFIDATGRIRYHHFGEGEYDKSERVIQGLLRESGAAGIDSSLVRINPEGPEVQARDDVQSPETYVGYARAAGFASPQRVLPDSRKTYSQPGRLALNQWALDGPWTLSGESGKLESAGGKIVFRFHGRDLHMVLGPGKGGAPVRFRVRLNGAAPGDDHGVDSAADGSGEVRQPRMYQLIRHKGFVQDATFEIEFLDPGVAAFSFTFG